MNSLEPTLPYSVTNAENSSCLQKPLTKAALLVIGLLFAVGAGASHFAGLGVPGIVAFSVASGVSILAFILACVRCPTTESQSENKLNERLDLVKKESKTAMRQIKLQDIKQMKTEDLIQLMICKASIDEEKMDLINQTFSIRIDDILSKHAQEGAKSVALALQPLFAELYSSPKQFSFIVSYIIIFSRYTPKFLASVLEQLDWPDEETKKETLRQGLSAKMLDDQYISIQNAYVDLSSGLKPKGFYTNRLVLRTKNIFGHGDFRKNPQPIPDSLAQAIDDAIKLTANTLIEKLREKQQAGTINAQTEIGLSLDIGQYRECKFSASMIAPLLPYLKNIPGLVELDLSDIGISMPWDKMETSGDAQGFRDEDADALLEIFRTNPCLTKVRFSVDGMSPAKLEQFMKEWEQIWKNKGFQAPSVEKLLSEKPTQAE